MKLKHRKPKAALEVVPVATHEYEDRMWLTANGRFIRVSEMDHDHSVR